MDPFFLIIQSRKWNSDIKHKHNYTTSSQINMGVYVKCMLVEMLIGFELWPLSSLFIQICRRKSDIKHKQNYTMSNQINMGVYVKFMSVEMFIGFELWPHSPLLIQICRWNSDIKHKQNYTMSNQINMEVCLKCMLVEMLVRVCNDTNIQKNIPSLYDSGIRKGWAESQRYPRKASLPSLFL